VQGRRAAAAGRRLGAPDALLVRGELVQRPAAAPGRHERGRWPCRARPPARAPARDPHSLACRPAGPWPARRADRARRNAAAAGVAWRACLLPARAKHLARAVGLCPVRIAVQAHPRQAPKREGLPRKHRLQHCTETLARAPAQVRADADAEPADAQRQQRRERGRGGGCRRGGRARRGRGRGARRGRAHVRAAAGVALCAAGGRGAAGCRRSGARRRGGRRRARARAPAGPRPGPVAGAPPARAGGRDVPRAPPSCHARTFHTRRLRCLPASRGVQGVASLSSPGARRCRR